MIDEGYEPTDFDLRIEARRAADERAHRQSAALVLGRDRACRVVHGLFDPNAAQRHARSADPTSILDDDECPSPVDEPARRPEMFAFGRRRWLPVGFVVHFQADAAAAKKAFDDSVAMVNNVFASASAVVDELAALAHIGIDDDDEQVVNRRRHGSASVCPRHGETKGGLCRKCAR